MSINLNLSYRAQAIFRGCADDDGIQPGCHGDIQVLLPLELRDCVSSDVAGKFRLQLPVPWCSLVTTSYPARFRFRFKIRRRFR